MFYLTQVAPRAKTCKRKKYQPRISQIHANKIKNSRNTALALGASVRGKELDFDLKVATCVIYNFS